MFHVEHSIQWDGWEELPSPRFNTIGSALLFTQLLPGSIVRSPSKVNFHGRHFSLFDVCMIYLFAPVQPRVALAQSGPPQMAFSFNGFVLINDVNKRFCGIKYPSQSMYIHVLAPALSKCSVLNVGYGITQLYAITVLSTSLGNKNMFHVEHFSTHPMSGVLIIDKTATNPSSIFCPLTDRFIPPYPFVWLNSFHFLPMEAFLFSKNHLFSRKPHLIKG